MPGLVGADVEELRALSRRFAAAADRLRAVVTETSGRLGSVRWAGPDSERFRAQWQSDSVARLRSAADALQEAATALQRNADEQEQASSVAGGGTHGGFGTGPSRPAWGWPGDVGSTPWFLRPGGGLPDPGMTPTLPGTNNGAGPQWSFPNPFDEYRDFGDKTPIWPINTGTAVGMTPLGDGANYADGAAASQWSDVAGEFAKADFSPATAQGNVAYIASDPGGAFQAARDAVVDHIPRLISNLTTNPFGK